MNKGMQIGERMFLRKKARRRFDLKMRTRCVIRETDKITGEKGREMGPFYNTIHTAGFDEFLRLIAGTSAQHFDASEPTIKLTTTLHGALATDAPDFLGGPSIGPTSTSVTKSAPSAAMSWEFHDDSIATYNPDFLEFWYGAWDAGAPSYEFCHIDISAAGAKPNNKNWHYHVILELYSTDVDLTNDCFTNMLLLFSGAAGINHMDATHVFFRPMSGSTTEIAGSDLAADGAPTVDTANDELVFTFTVPDGTFNGTWTHSRVKHHMSGASTKINMRSGGCKTDGSSCGTKSAGEEWQYTWAFAISQGS